MDKALWDLSQYRMEQAERCIRSAKVLADDEDYTCQILLSKNKGVS